ncbi:hypothetical protein PF005_g9441 [Phytophthora fragariae]|uniref:Uncharacterized protein n=1 Tax=Phytophthora fragariae TaxID=53985 RepID=A0A6A3L096_9STRA|nr:hypothetical protein PF003_g33512 [Phytophthora fragariae]KAE8939490.1 hypothetical protein PF009_g10664 [Phytophthora fragariae]KAE9013011.1 hypothetical protein PF011_g8667 [Phytophthora fragariae]KAE9116591.1 hypothetical protein PF007_g9604 [Phytophthora fragariae]KAE9116837.1 hypothetical protein PF010_g8816 [Phytophthora fragariae]
MLRVLTFTIHYGCVLSAAVMTLGFDKFGTHTNFCCKNTVVLDGLHGASWLCSFP